MAWLPMYLLDKDVELLNEWLNQEEEIAYLISSGPKSWIAQKEHTVLDDIGTQLRNVESNFTMPNTVEYNLWHVPSGALPLLGYTGEGWWIDNPWSGWTEIRTGANARIPYFGAGHPGVISVNINLPHGEEIRMSCFGWIGNHYRIIGNGADPSTEKFWNKLKRVVKKMGVQIPRSDNAAGKKEIFALPSAYEEIINGRPCSLNP